MVLCRERFYSNNPTHPTVNIFVCSFFDWHISGIDQGKFILHKKKHFCLHISKHENLLT